MDTTDDTATAGRTTRRTWPFIAGGLALGLVAAGSAVYANAHKTITLDVDGHVQTVSTFSGSVEGLLAENDVTVGPDDLVAPSASAALSDNTQVVVRYAREITLQKDGVPTTITTTAVDADELLSTYASRGDDVSLVASRSTGEGRTDLGLRLSLDGPVQLKVDGKQIEVADGTEGVAEILKDNGVVLGDLDRLSVEHLPTEAALAAQAAAAPAADAAPDADAAQDPADVTATAATEDAPATDEAPASEDAPATEDPAAPATDAPTGAPAPDVLTDPRLDETELTIVVKRVAVADETTETAVPFETVTEQDASRFKDLPVVTQTEGVEGVQTTTYSVTTVDGVEESRELVSDETTTAPVTHVLVQGTKERPKVVVKPKAVTPTAPSAPAGDQGAPAEAPAAPVVTGDVWGQLAKCESGGNPSIVSSNGKYHGLYQFSVGTWQSLGGAGLPSQASAEEQTRLAQALQARSGWGQWPACSKKLGLR